MGVLKCAIFSLGLSFAASLSVAKCSHLRGHLLAVWSLICEYWVHGAIAIFSMVAAYVLAKLLLQPSIPDIEVDLKSPVARKSRENKQDPEMKVMDPERKDWIQCWNPSTGTYLGEVRAMNANNVKDLVRHARVAQPKWAATSFAERRRVLKALDKCILKNREELCKKSCIDTGKTQLEAILGEIMVTSGKIDWVCNHGEEYLKPEKRNPPMVMAHKSAWVEYSPLGVLGVIAPWNYPFHNLYNHIISGLFTGNAVVVKVSEHSAWCAEYYIRIIQQVLATMGYPPRLVSLVQGFSEAGSALVSGGVDKVIFTGSPGVGKHVMRGAAETLTPVVLELGGKDPFIVTENADLSQTVQIAIRGAYQNCGQNCVGAERFFVYESVYEEFVESAAQIVRGMKQGPAVLKNGKWNHVDIGATTTSFQLQHVKKMVDEAVSQGARVVCGGKINKSEELKMQDGENGLFFEPTVLADVTEDMHIAQEEVFGPVMTMIKVKGDSDDEAIRLTNGIDYGLGSSIFCKDVKRANNMAHKIYAGMSAVNDFGTGYLVQDMPFGGVKLSGFSRFAGKEGLRECCLMKSVVSDKFGNFGIRTSIPPRLGYPMQGDSTIRFALGLVDFQFAHTLWGKLEGIRNLIW